MPRADNRYSQFVSAAKIILPLAGLGLMSSLFLISGAGDTQQEIPFSEVELEEIVEGQRIFQPRYQTVLDDGSELELVAESARPLLTNPNQFMANEISGRVFALDGLQVDIRAARGVVDNATDTVRVEGGLRLSRTDGFVLSAEGAEARLDGQTAQSRGDVIVLGPGITLNAGSAEYRRDPESGAAQLLFTQGVKLVYTPQ
ncbi:MULTISPECIES: hypothetical protein [unclassified Dinoroseobacter]|uniref:hypothetical protein n=1 Tax=unclassified Dinoroseobacter TaxID=2620028 RepID=UPI003C7E32A0